MYLKMTEKGQRSRFFLQPGTWFCTVKRTHETASEPEQRPDVPSDVRTIGKNVQCVTLSSQISQYAHSRHRSLTDRRLYWSEQPFALHLRSRHFSWITLPYEVSDSGFRPWRSPLCDKLEYVESYTRGSGSWTNLLALVQYLKVDPITLLMRHLDHFNGRHDPKGIHFLYATTPEAAREQPTMGTITIPILLNVVTPKLEHIWVRKRFALTALALHALEPLPASPAHSTHPPLVPLIDSL